MTTATTQPPKVWTAEDLLAMPDDGVRRWIINGQLREQPPEIPGVKMTVRNRHHGRIMAVVAGLLGAWLKARPEPRGEIYCGEVGVRLPGRATVIGVDVAYAAADLVAAQTDESPTLLNGVPTLVVEILSPNSAQAHIKEKIGAYRSADVPLVWVIKPHDRMVTFYRPGEEPEGFNIKHRLPEDPHMPGFAPAVAELFE